MKATLAVLFAVGTVLAVGAAVFVVGVDQTEESRLFEVDAPATIGG